MKQLLVILTVLCSATVFAQDIIVKKDGSTILSKVLEVGSKEVKYKKFSNQNGPVYSISISGILSINYENGEKEDFSNAITNNQNGEEATDNSASQNSSHGLINKPAAANNSEIIALHNVVHPYFGKKNTSVKPAKGCTIKFGVSSSSIMSTEDVEISFIRGVRWDWDYDRELCYFINIKNKTDKVLYIDRGNCFAIYDDGSSRCYYDASSQTTVNQGGGSGGSVNLGSVAGALGIGGIIGQVAGGVNVGGGKSSSISTSYATQRVIAIPPHGRKYLTDDVWIGEGKTRTCVEMPEFFTPFGISLREMGIGKGDISKGETKVFVEDDLPWKREFYITYSTDANFNTYSVLKTKLFIQEIIGEDENLYIEEELLKRHEKQVWFLNNNTIVAHNWLFKKK